MTALIEVTEYDIATAILGYNAVSCPVALALRRATGYYWRVFRLPCGRFSARRGEEIPGSILPEEVSLWIDRFDRARTAERRTLPPIKFSMDNLPEATLAIIE